MLPRHHQSRLRNPHKTQVVNYTCRMHAIKKHVRMTTSATFVDVMTTSNVATLCKTVSFVFTYPFETYKMYSQLGKTVQNPIELYNGFGMFLLMATLQCYVNYNIFFSCIAAMSPHVSKHVAILLASFISCFLLSFVRVPISFINRNIVFYKGCLGVDAVQFIMQQFTFDLYKRGWIINILTDIPDSFVKFFLNTQLSMLPSINVFTRSFLTGVVTCVINMPLDYVLTTTLCQVVQTEKQSMKSGVEGCVSGLPYRVLASVIGNVVFFYMFNTIRPVSI